MAMEEVVVEVMEVAEDMAEVMEAVEDTVEVMVEDLILEVL